MDRTNQTPEEFAAEMMEIQEAGKRMRELEISKEMTWRDEQGFVRMELLPEETREELPPLWSTDGQGDGATVHVKLFSPSGPFTWYVTEFDGTDTCFGYVENAAEPHFSELGYFSLSELEGVGDLERLVLPIERDIAFSPKSLAEAKLEA